MCEVDLSGSIPRTRRSESSFTPTAVAARDSTSAGTRGDRLTAGVITALLVLALGWVLFSSYADRPDGERSHPGIVVK